jgi:hypothetical protein
VARGSPHQQVVVTSKQQFDMAVQQYMSMGYGPRQITSELAILVKPGENKPLGCAFWFWVFVFFPVAILMAINHNKQGQELTVTIRLDLSAGSVLPPPPSGPAMPQELVMSEDRQHWWDGANWVAVDQATPPMAKKNADGTLWWDGEKWQAAR